MSAAHDEKYGTAPNDEKEQIILSITTVDLQTESMPIDFKQILHADSLPDGRVIVSEAKENRKGKGKLTVWNLDTGECEVVVNAETVPQKFKVIDNHSLISYDKLDSFVERIFFSETPKQEHLGNEVKSFAGSITTVDLQYSIGRCCFGYCPDCSTFPKEGSEISPFTASFDFTSKGGLVTLHESGRVFIDDNDFKSIRPEVTMRYYYCVKVNSPNESHFCRRNCRCFCCAQASTQIDFNNYEDFSFSCCMPLYAQWDKLYRLTDNLIVLSSFENSTLTLLDIHARQFSADYKLERPPGVVIKWRQTAINQLGFIADGFYYAASFSIYRAEANLNLRYFGACTSIPNIFGIKSLCSGTGFVILNHQGIHLFDLETRKIVHSHLEDQIERHTFHVRQTDGAVIYFSQKNKAGIMHYQREMEFFEYKRELQAARAFRIVSKKLPEQKKIIIRPLVNAICTFVTPDFYGKFFKSRNQLLPEVDHATGMPKKTDAPTMTR